MYKKAITVSITVSFACILSCNSEGPAGPLKNGENSGSWTVSGNILTDPDGNTYTTVTIGNQVWTVENLKTTRYNDGSAIQHVPETGVTGEKTGWQNITTGAYCYYDNIAVNEPKHGVLYNWYALNTGKLAPEGWSVPTEEDWTTLSNYLGGESVAGGKMKVAGTTQWAVPNTRATDSSGFSALPGGYRDYDGSFHGQGEFGLWWSATEFSATFAYYHSLGYQRENLYKTSIQKNCGFSLRLVRK